PGACVAVVYVCDRVGAPGEGGRDARLGACGGPRAVRRRGDSAYRSRRQCIKWKQGDSNMPAKILIPTALRPYAGNLDAIEVQASTVGEAMGSLASRFPDLKKHLYTDDGRLRSFVNVFVGDEDIRARQNEKTPVQDGDVISVIPSIA